VFRIILFSSVVALWVSCASVPGAATGHIDHVILGVADLNAATEAFERATGVRPVYGGKHPGGTHNALISLGNGSYVELLAVQPGVTVPAEMADLVKLDRPTPVGWAVSGSNVASLQNALRESGLTATEPARGSRVTPAGLTLRWQAFGLTTMIEEAPFFIVWDPETTHPSLTSPGGCSLDELIVTGPHTDELGRLKDAMRLPVKIQNAPKPGYTLRLKCPRGAVTFASEQ
jgi:hypothetical protein